MSVRLLRGISETAFTPFIIPSMEWSADQESVASADVLLRGQSSAPAPEHQAEFILADAQQEAALLLEETRARIAALEAEARARGLESAQQIINEQIQERVGNACAELRERMGEALREIDSLRARIVAESEQDLVELSLQIARKIIRQELTTSPEIIQTLTRVALAQLNSRTVARVRLHPEDARYLRQWSASERGSIEIIEDGAIERGGCVVQSERGTMDARIETQLTVIRDQLTGNE